jgi:hypothetical protein
LAGRQGVGVPFEISFPPTALATDTCITVTETALPPPPGFVDWSPVYRIDPVGLTLATAATVKVPFSQGREVAYGGGELFWSAESPCTLARLPSSYTNAGFNNANVGRLGYAISGRAQGGSATLCQ